jgi:hypothetical protein
VFLALVPVCILAVSVTGCGAPAIPSVGNLVLSPTSVSFGSVQVGQTAAATLSLGNNGSASIQISQIQFSSPDFSLSGPAALPITLAVGESYILTLKFAPSAPGAASGSMSLATSGLSAPATVSLSGTGEAKPATPGLRTAALTISGVSATSRGFSASGLTLPASLNPGQTANLIISFNPTVAGTATGSVTLVTNATSGSATVPLSATGVKTLYEVDLTWEQPASSSDPPVGYEIFRAVNGSAVYTLLNSTIDPSTAYTDTTAQNGATYSYYVESVDNEGNQSAPSTIFSVTIPN